MYKIDVEITGIVSLKLNRPTEEELESIDKGTRKSGKATYEEKKDAWKKKVLSDAKGYYVESRMIRSNVMNGLGLPVPLVSNKIKCQRPKVRASLFISPHKIYIDGKLDPKPDLGWTINKQTKQLVITRKPIFPKWKMSFGINVVDDFLLEEVLKDGIVRAGRCHGLGSDRPDFGRYVISKWQRNGN